MHNQKHMFRSIVRSAGFIFCLSVCILMVSSCTPLRKKFTRKKKENRENDERFIPVLDPIDYPEKVILSKDQYSHHYSLWKVWDKDLLQNIESDGSEKRQKYLLSQSITHLDEMALLLNGVQRTQLIELISNYQLILQEYKSLLNKRSKHVIKRKIERNGRQVRTHYAPKLLEGYWDHQQSKNLTTNNE